MSDYFEHMCSRIGDAIEKTNLERTIKTGPKFMLNDQCVAWQLSLDVPLMFTIQKLLLKFRARSLIRKMTRPRPGLGSDTSLSMRHDDGSLGNHISA